MECRQKHNFSDCYTWSDFPDLALLFYILYFVHLFIHTSSHQYLTPKATFRIFAAWLLEYILFSLMDCFVFVMFSISNFIVLCECLLWMSKWNRDQSLVDWSYNNVLFFQFYHRKKYHWQCYPTWITLIYFIDVHLGIFTCMADVISTS